MQRPVEGDFVEIEADNPIERSDRFGFESIEDASVDPLVVPGPAALCPTPGDRGSLRCRPMTTPSPAGSRSPRNTTGSGSGDDDTRGDDCSSLLTTTVQQFSR
ncbi:MAG: hypothetical protein GY788_08855 [bacterium]|nr:hypothetical protein [bacterium]